MVHSELTGHVGWRYHLLLLPISWTMNCLCLPSKSPWGVPGGAEEYQEQPGPAECGRRRRCLWPGPHHGWGHVTEPRGTWKVPTETSRPASSPRNSMGALAHTGLGEHVEEEGGVLRHSRDILGLPLACVLCFSKERPDHHLSLLQKNPSRLWQLMNLGGTSQPLASHSVTQLPTQLPSVLQPKGRSHSCGLNSRPQEGLTSLPLFQIQNPHQALLPALSQVPMEGPGHISQPVRSCGPVGVAPVGSKKQNKRQMGQVP